MEYRSRKEEEFDNIYRLYANDIYRVCLHFTRDEDLAQDIMQRVFVEFYDYFETVSPDCVFAYLVRAVKNLVCSLGIDVKENSVR